jgi:hypothetical protein
VAKAQLGLAVLTPQEVRQTRLHQSMPPYLGPGRALLRHLVAFQGALERRIEIEEFEREPADGIGDTRHPVSVPRRVRIRPELLIPLPGVRVLARRRIGIAEKEGRLAEQKAGMGLLGQRGPLMQQGYAAGKVPPPLEQTAKRHQGLGQPLRVPGIPGEGERLFRIRQGFDQLPKPPGEYPDAVGKAVGQARRVRQQARHGQRLFNRLPRWGGSKGMRVRIYRAEIE